MVLLNAFSGTSESLIGQLLQVEVAAFHRENDPATPTDDGAIYWHVPHYKNSAPYSAVRKGDFKLIRYREDNDSLHNRSVMEDGYFMSERERYDLPLEFNYSNL